MCIRDRASSGVQASVHTDAWHTGLNVKNLRTNEAGLYKVKVSNKAGSKTATFTIEVKGMYTKSIWSSVFELVIM